MNDLDQVRLDTAVRILDDTASALRVLASGCDDGEIAESLAEIADDVQQHIEHQIAGARKCIIERERAEMAQRLDEIGKGFMVEVAKPAAARFDDGG